MKESTTARAGAALAAAMAISTALAQVASGAEPAAEPMPAHHPVGCGAYDIEIATELNLLDEPGTAVNAAGSASDAGPMLDVAQTYRVTLVPQAGAKLLVAPRRHVLEEGAFAGMMSFKVPEAGTWRVSTSRETWIEIAGPGGALKSSRFQGREGCPQMRKFVEFPLEPGVAYTLQLSGGVDPDMKVLVTGPIAAR